MHTRSMRLLYCLLPAGLIAQTATSPENFQGPAPVIVQIRVIRGDKAVHTVGSKTSAGLTVEVTDEVGKPIEGATVNFRLPSKGPGGEFSNRLITDLAITDSAGRATVSGVKWNTIPGPFQIRVTAAKGEARAGIVVPQYLSERPSGSKTAPLAAEVPNPGRKWVKIAVIVAGAAAGSVAAGLALGRRSPSAPEQASPPALSVGTPVITIGGP